MLDVIIPIYDGLKESKDCVLSTIHSLTKNTIDAQIIVINDNSPCAALGEWLRETAASGRDRRASRRGAPGPQGVSVLQALGPGSSQTDNDEAFLCGQAAVRAAI